MKGRLKEFLVTVGWSINTASSVLQAIYQPRYYPGYPLAAFNVVFLFVMSVLAGMVLVDVEIVVFGYVGALSLSVLLMFVSLSLPALLGEVIYAPLKDVLYSGIVVLIFQTIFPGVIILCLMGGLLGSFFGERLGFD